MTGAVVTMGVMAATAVFLFLMVSAIDWIETRWGGEVATTVVLLAAMSFVLGMTILTDMFIDPENVATQCICPGDPVWEELEKLGDWRA